MSATTASSAAGSFYDLTATSIDGEVSRAQRVHLVALLVWCVGAAVDLWCRHHRSLAS